MHTYNNLTSDTLFKIAYYVSKLDFRKGIQWVTEFIKKGMFHEYILIEETLNEVYVYVIFNNSKELLRTELK